MLLFFRYTPLDIIDAAMPCDAIIRYIPLRRHALLSPLLTPYAAAAMIIATCNDTPATLRPLRLLMPLLLLLVYREPRSCQVCHYDAY